MDYVRSTRLSLSAVNVHSHSHTLVFQTECKQLSISNSFPGLSGLLFILLDPSLVQDLIRAGFQIYGEGVLFWPGEAPPTPPPPVGPKIRPRGCIIWSNNLIKAGDYTITDPGSASFDLHRSLVCPPEDVTWACWKTSNRWGGGGWWYWDRGDTWTGDMWTGNRGRGLGHVQCEETTQTTQTLSKL